MGYIKNYSDLAINDKREVVLDLIEAAFASIQPENELQKNFRVKENILKIQNKTYNLNDYEKTYILGFGKGSAGISKIMEQTLGIYLTGGYVIDTNEETFEKLELTIGTHPLPSQTNIDFTEKVIENFGNLSEKTLVLVVICGGGSALFESPFNITLEKLTEVNKALLHSGANIIEMNTIRKHLSKVKGGGLAQILSPAKVVSLIFSDVPGNEFSFIASGPTVFDKTTILEALDIYNKYRLENLNLKEEDFTETPKEEELFSKIDNVLMLSNLTALNAMLKKAEELKIKAEIYSDKFQSDAELAGKALIEKTKPHSILLTGGETTIKVSNPDGKGGRNQVVVLSSLYSLDKNTVIASFDSDGWDNTPNAGAIGDSETLEKAKKLGINPEEFLKDDNSFSFFRNVGDAIITDRLPSNVSDLVIIYNK